MKSHVKAAIYGALLGDAIGARLEFKRHVSKQELKDAMNLRGGGPHRLAPAQITDDGEMILCILNGILDLGRHDHRNTVENYAAWFNSDPFDYGSTISAAFSHIANNKVDISIEKIEERSWSYNLESLANGALMRIPGFSIVVGGLSKDETISLAINDTLLTHPNEICQHSSAAYLLALRHLIIHKGDAEGAYKEAYKYLARVSSKEVLSWLIEAKEQRPIDYHSHEGYVKVAFMCAFKYMLKNKSFKESISEIISYGADADTNACIAGALIGARDGISSIDKDLIHKLDNCNTALGQSRPPFYSTSDLNSRIDKFLDK